MTMEKVIIIIRAFKKQLLLAILRFTYHVSNQLILMNLFGLFSCFIGWFKKVTALKQRHPHLRVLLAIGGDFLI